MPFHTYTTYIHACSHSLLNHNRKIQYSLVIADKGYNEGNNSFSFELQVDPKQDKANQCDMRIALWDVVNLLGATTTA